ncbi:MAG: hypothetical protein CM15mP2_4400 [Methanobacteriota archaeon]|nr:MAG: hypothetical protein CM15mP2_4400 [Euryarchaeota archaeon]
MPSFQRPNVRRGWNRWSGWQIPCEASALAMQHDRPGILSMAKLAETLGAPNFSLQPWQLRG